MIDHIPPPSGLCRGAIVWAYLRDSGGEAQEQSIGQQRDVIVAYCLQHGFILAHVFADEAKSGGSVAGRESFTDMIDMAADAGLRPAGILVWNFARFARDLDDSNYYKTILRKQGIIIHSLTDPIPAGEWGRVIEVVIDIANAEKRRQTSRDVKRALQALTRQGFACGGFPPRGYKAEPVIVGHKRGGAPRSVSRWVPDPDTWELVKLAWAMRAQGKPYKAIRDACPGLFHSKTCWSSFFRNKTYLGIGKCGDLEVPDHHPAAIDAATWEAVQRLRQAAPRMKQVGHLNNPRRIGAPSLLSGLAVCLQCGQAINYGRTNKGTWPYYICGKKQRQGYATCEARMINARTAEAAIIGAVCDRVLTPDLITDLLAEVRTQLSDTSALDRQAEALSRQLAESERAIANLLELAETFGSRAAGEKLRDRESGLDRLTFNLRQVEAQRAASQIEVTPEALGAALAAWRGEIAEARKAHDVIALRAFLMRFVSKIELGYNTARLWYSYPLEALRQIRTLPRGGTPPK